MSNPKYQYKQVQVSSETFAEIVALQNHLLKSLGVKLSKNKAISLAARTTIDLAKQSKLE